LDLFRKLSVNLNHTISDRLAHEINDMAPILAGKFLELYQAVENFYLQGMSIYEIYEQIDGAGFDNILNKSILQKIA
jgi:hypothetical protein